ncbi:MAG TPA: type IV toxin-antitoxin system AbiEi family antitoxin domain-containing protein [Acidimicrobiales bacterium]|nr:type IV toxin-antitoxin system AbiEi family antitoxin domain-containing protein [Acidimicrobiales bacterium]
MTSKRVGEILAVAGRQHGLVRVDRLDRVGIDRSAVWRLTDAGVLERFGGPGIRRVAGGEVTPHQRLLAAVWATGPGAAASHRSAGWLWGLDAVTQPAPEVSVPPGVDRRPAGVIVHRASDLAPRSSTVVDGIPVTEPTRTLVDLASVIGADDLECAFDSALRQGLTSLPRAAAVLRRLGRRGRRGIGPFRALVEGREGATGVTESMFEMRLVQVLRRAGLPEPVRQLTLHDQWGLIGRFDCAYPEAQVAIEADSVRFHHSRERFEADRERRSRAEALGWRVPTFTWRQVSRRGQWVASTVAAVLDASGWNWRAVA